MEYLEVRKLSKSFDQTMVLKNLDLDLEKHSTLSVLGKSGCGKTTLLKLISGLESPDTGTVSLDGQYITDLHAGKRGIVYLYQEALLFPHMNVFENIAFGLRVRDHTKPEVQTAVETLSERLGISDQLKKKPHQLSGGQKQRVSFGRAVIVNPQLLLLDEPFGNLDVETRSQMQAFYKEQSTQLGITSIFVTHDLKEAVIMGDRYAVMKEGVLKEFSSYEEFKQYPGSGLQDEVDFWKELDRKS